MMKRERDCWSMRGGGGGIGEREREREKQRARVWDLR